MDEKEFKAVYGDINGTPCVYQKAILTRRCECPHAHKLNLAEREAVACGFMEAREQCQQLYSSFIEKARFALKKTSNDPLTHGESIKVQVGGITGLQKVLGDNSETPRVGQLTMKAFMRYPGLIDLPIEPIIREIVTCVVRRKRKSKLHPQPN